MLQQGQVAAISTDDSVLAGLAAQDPQTRIVGPRFTCEPHGLAMSRASGARDFVRFVNGVLEQMRTDGTWQQLYDQWVAPHLGPRLPPRPSTRSESRTAAPGPAPEGSLGLVPRAAAPA